MHSDFECLTDRTDKLDEKSGVSEFEWDMPFTTLLFLLKFISYIIYIKIHYVGNNISI